uniref:LysR family transcriptional regulator n=1 Tax=Macrostomum lignano TaxID=282301 RepID=A0A1I8JRJ4_9PLAT
NTKQIVATPGAEVFVILSVSISRALNSIHFRRIVPRLSIGLATILTSKAAVGSSVAELERVKRVDFAADHCDVIVWKKPLHGLESG